MPFLTPDTLPDDFVCRRVRIPNDVGWLELVNGALSVLTKPYNYEAFGSITPEQCAEILSEMFFEYQRDAPCMLGSIIPYATSSSPEGTLPCDGSSFNRVDYPQLYAVLDTAYIVDADTFVTPDLQGRTIIGVGAGTDLTERAIGDSGGEETHVLTTSELAAHTHDTEPHSHSDSGHVHGYLYPTLNLDLESPGVPDLFAAGNPPISLITDVGYASLSSETVTVDSTGEDGQHQNMQPFHALRYCIIAR